MISEDQARDLKDFWRRHDGLDRLADDFVKELGFFMQHCPTLITDSKKKIETEESKAFAAVATHCEKLERALRGISDLDRLNILSLREARPEYGGKAMPLVDPLEYVSAIRELAGARSYELKRLGKYTRQLLGLREFVKRFPPLKDISRSRLVELASLLWPAVGSGDFERAYRPENWKADLADRLRRLRKK